jgi:hypothetical protein
MPSSRSSRRGLAIRAAQSAGGPTRSQVATLKHICADLGVEVPSGLTRREASEEIAILSHYRDIPRMRDGDASVLASQACRRGCVQLRGGGFGRGTRR